MALAAGFGVLSYLVIYEPLVARGSPPFVVLVASLGLFIVIANTLAIVFGTDAKTLPDFSYGIYFIGDVVVTGVQIAQVLVFVMVALALSAFLKYEIGRAHV